MDIEGAAIVVTGASSGIGRATAPRRGGPVAPTVRVADPAAEPAPPPPFVRTAVPS